MVRFEKNPSGGCLTNGIDMVGVNVNAVPGGNANRPSSVIQIKRFRRECGCCESVSMNSSCSRSSTNELVCCVVVVVVVTTGVADVSAFGIELESVLATAINTVSAIVNKAIFEVFLVHSHVEVMFVVYMLLEFISCEKGER